MPDLEISNLPELTGAALAATDPFAVADLSASATKKITAKNLVQSGLGLVDDASIPAAKIAVLGATQLASNSVTTPKITDGAVSTAKIADAGVTDAKLATGLSGSKLSNASVTASKLGTVTDRGLDQVGGNVGHSNSLTAGTASGISFDAQGHVTSTTSIPAADLPAGTATAIGGVSVPSGSGLTVSGAGALDHESSIAAATTANIVYDAHGHITAIAALTADHLPAATTVAKGAVSIPTSGKLEVTSTGVLSLSNTAVTPGVHTKVTVDAQGRVTSGTGLDAADIPDLNVSKLTTGQVPTVRIADDAVTAAKLADRSTATIAQATPANGAFIGQTHLNSLTGDYFLWDGNVWQPIGISVGEIVLAGTYNASTNKVATVTSEGTALGFAVGSALPAASSANKSSYVVVSTAGTGSSPAPTVQLNPPDFLLSTGSEFTEIDVSNTVTAQQASNVAFTASGNIAATNVQAAIQELDTEKITAASPTLTGVVTLGTAATLAFEGGSANAFETTLTVVDPTADRTVTLPDTTGTVVTTGDTGTVTSTMLVGSIADSKLSQISTADKVAGAAITAGSIANTKLANDSVSFGGISLDLGETDATPAFNLTDATNYPTSSLSGTITNAQLAGSIADSKLSTITTAGKVSGSALTSGTIAGSTAVGTSGAIATTSTLAVGQASATSNVDLDVAGTYAGNVVSVAALNIDCSTGNYFTKSVSASSTFTFSNVPASRAFAFTVEVNCTGSSTAITWPAAVKFPNNTGPTLTDTKTHLFLFVTDNGGTTFRGASLANYTT